MNFVGGIFSFPEVLSSSNGLFDNLTPQGGDIRFLMSGRCGNFYALEDLKLLDKKRVAYVPLYTCETVTAPFVKAGYELKFYPCTREMEPIFDESVLDEISVISICGYFGFCNYDRDFVRRCKERGIVVIQDTTHSVLSKDGVDPNCDYIVGSLRKWIGVACGGFAIKTKGKFEINPLPVDEAHLATRMKAIEDKSSESFWDAEMTLRKIFSHYASDSASEHIMRHFDVEGVSRIRRENYAFILENLPESNAFCSVFPVLPSGTVPSHFTILVKEREKAQALLKELGINSTVYWPVGPLVCLEGQDTTAYVYNHVLSLPCDQRWGKEEMLRICKALELV